MKYEISAVVCTFNRYEFLDKVINSLLTQDVSQELLQIIIVDNTPPELSGKGKQYAEQYAKVKNLTYHFESITGLSNARNVGFRLSSAKYIAYIDDDAIATPQWIKSVLGAFKAYPNVGVVGGAILPVWKSSRPNWLTSDMLNHLSVVDWGGDTRIARENEWMAGANLSFRREILEASGGFSTSLGRKGAGKILLSNEESEVINYVKKSAYELVYEPKAIVHHRIDNNRLDRKWFRKRVAWQAVSDYIMDPNKAEENINSEAELLFENKLMAETFQSTDTAGEFTIQLENIYKHTILLLSGVEKA